MNHLNYALNVQSRKSVIRNCSPIYKTVSLPDGSLSVVEVEKHESPFEGMSADSFTLDAQLKAGVRLMPSPRNEEISIGRVDAVCDAVNTVIDANRKGKVLNSSKVIKKSNK